MSHAPHQRLTSETSEQDRMSRNWSFMLGLLDSHRRRCTANTASRSDTSLAEPDLWPRRGLFSELESDINTSSIPTHTDSAPAAVNSQQLVPQSSVDTAESMRQQCATLKRGRVTICGMCGEQILHVGNGKLHENCRSLRDTMGEGPAKRHLHAASAQRGKKRDGKDDPYWREKESSDRQPSYKKSKKEDPPPPLPPPAQRPESDDDSD